MLDGNVLLRHKRDEVPEGTLSCPDRNLAVFHHYRHYEGLRLLPSVYDSKLIQQTLIIKKRVRHNYMTHPFLTNTLMVSLLCSGVFFLLAHFYFSVGRGK